MNRLAKISGITILGFIVGTWMISFVLIQWWQAKQWKQEFLYRTSSSAILEARISFMNGRKSKYIIDGDREQSEFSHTEGEFRVYKIRYLESIGKAHRTSQEVYCAKYNEMMEKMAKDPEKWKFAVLADEEGAANQSLDPTPPAAPRPPE